MGQLKKMVVSLPSLPTSSVTASNADLLVLGFRVQAWMPLKILQMTSVMGPGIHKCSGKFGFWFRGGILGMHWENGK